MKGSKLGGTVSNTVTLGSPNYASPLTVLASGVVTLSGSGDAIYGPNSQGWRVVNEGQLQVSGASGDGIELDADGRAVNSGTIFAPDNGIYIGGVGSVVDSGTVTAAEDAIDLKGGGRVGIAKNGAVATTGTAFSAIYIGGVGTVVDLGLISSNGLNGIELAGGGRVTITATGSLNSTYSGVGYSTAVDIGGGTGTVVDQGLIESSCRTGIGLAEGGRVTIAATGSVISTYAGAKYASAIGIGGAAGTVVNYGKISASGGNELTGIVLLDGGSVDNTGTILAPAGIYVGEAAGKVVNSGKIIASGGLGVELYAGGKFTNTAHGYVEGAFAGYNGVSVVINKGRIIAANGDGASFEGGPATLANTGTIEGLGKLVDEGGYIRGDEGVFLGDGGTVSNGKQGSHRGLIEGYHYGVLAEGTAESVSNFGTIESTQTSMSSLIGVGVLFSYGGSLDNAGLVSGEEGVMVVSGAVTIANSGTIRDTETAGLGLHLGGGGSLFNSGLIDGTVYIPNAAADIVNRGTILSSTGTSSAGIYMTGGGSVSNDKSGTITGNYLGVSANKAALTVKNSGYIGGETSGGGVGLYASGAVTNAGTISGTATHAIYISGGGTVANTGLVEGAAGIDVTGGVGTITDSGSIVANPGSDGGRAVALYDGGYVTLAKTGRATASAATAVYITGAGGTVVNSGHILSAQDNGVDLYLGGVVLNHGLIESHADYSALYVGGQNAAAGFVGVENSGTIRNAGGYDGVHIVKVAGAYLVNSHGLIDGGETGIYIGGYQGQVFPTSVATIFNSGEIIGTSGYGIYLAAGGTITDSGSIGGNGTAILFGGTGSNLLQLEAGFKLSGDVVGSGSVGASNTLELSGKKPGVLIFNDTLFQSFGTIEVDAAASWTLFGDASGADFINDGAVTAGKKQSFIFDTVSADPSAHGTIMLANGGGAEFTAGAGTDQTLVFRDATEQLTLDSATTFTATIDGFRKGDAIGLKNIAATHAVFSSGTLTISNMGVTVGTLSLQGHYTANEFRVTSLGAAGSEITIGKPTKMFVFPQPETGSSDSSAANHLSQRAHRDGAGFGLLAGGKHWGKQWGSVFTPFGHTTAASGGGGVAAGGGASDAGSLLPWATDPFHFWTIQG